MLRSELRPRRSWIADVGMFVTVVTILVAVSLGLAVLTYHLWRDDRRADRLRELDKQVRSARAVFTPPHDVDVDKEFVVWDRVLNQEFVTVHLQARTPSPSKRRDIGIKVTQDDIIKLVKTKVEEVGKTYEAPTNDWWCAHQCSPGADCYAMWIEDRTNHVLLTLPCVNGKPGTWTMEKLP